MKNSTCILYFSFSPEFEASRKRWTPSKLVNLKVARQLDGSVRKVIRSTGLPFVEVNERDQSNSSFGCRISKAIESVFEKGFEHIIVIGNDCPDVSRNDILTAQVNSQQGIFTVGKTRDGGAYLFSISQNLWKNQSFSTLAWCTSELGSDLVHYLDQVGQVSLLSDRSDLDYFKDIVELFLLSKSKISCRLKNIVSQTEFYITSITAFHQTTILTSPERGPPVLL